MILPYHLQLITLNECSQNVITVVRILSEYAPSGLDNIYRLILVSVVDFAKSARHVNNLGHPKVLWCLRSCLRQGSHRDSDDTLLSNFKKHTVDPVNEVLLHSEGPDSVALMIRWRMGKLRELRLVQVAVSQYTT